MDLPPSVRAPRGTICLGSLGVYITNIHINPYTYFVYALQRISTTKAFDVADLVPIRWKELFAPQPLKSNLETQ